MIHIIDLELYLTNPPLLERRFVKTREESSPAIDCNAREAVMYSIIEEQHSER